jgi:hypothetical protein
VRYHEAMKTVRLPDDLHARLKATSFLLGRPAEALFRDAVAAWIEANAPEPGPLIGLPEPETAPRLADPDQEIILAELRAWRQKQR